MNETVPDVCELDLRATVILPVERLTELTLQSPAFNCDS
jgi:hypothetical protein